MSTEVKFGDEEHLPLEVFWVCPTGGRPRGRPKTRWQDYVIHLVWEHLRRSWKILLGRGTSGLPA